MTGWELYAKFARHKMENFCEDIFRSVVNFKLVRCCFVAPLRMGILIIGYFNILVSVILIIGTATDSFMPTIKHVQDQIMEEGSKSTCILVPITELGFSVLLLCAMHRNDVVLLRFYMLYAIAATLISVLVYTLVIAIVDILYIFVIVASILYQAYIVVLVRSAIVDIKLRTRAENNGVLNHKPTGTHLETIPNVVSPDEIQEPEVVTVEIEKTEFKKIGDKKHKETKAVDIDTNVDEKTDDKKGEHKKTEDKKVDDKNCEDKNAKKDMKTKVDVVNETKLETIQETPKVTSKDA